MIGKINRDPVAEPLYLNVRECLKAGLKPEFIHAFPQFPQLIKIMRMVENVSDFVESIIDRFPTWVWANLKVELYSLGVC